MSVNIFGSSGRDRSSAGNNKYVDSKFITLAQNLQSKVDKQYVDELISRTSSMIEDKVTKEYVDAQDGLTKTYIDMKLTDSVTKTSVDNGHFKNNVGLVPDLNNNGENKSGFKVSSSSEYHEHLAFHIFNSSKGNWNAFSSPQRESWIKLQCTEPIKIHKFTVRGRTNDANENTKILGWRLQGSNDDVVWIDLYKGIGEIIDQKFKTFLVPLTAGYYIYYRFLIKRAEGGDPGLSHLQLYSVDSII
jgi:hypothetical protein